MINQSRAKALIALKKARSHMNKVIKMVEDGEYCIDVLQQNMAVMGLLKSVDYTLLENHLNHCFKTAMKTSNSAQQQKMIGEILKVAKLANK